MGLTPADEPLIPLRLTLILVACRGVVLLTLFSSIILRAFSIERLAETLVLAMP